MSTRLPPVLRLLRPREWIKNVFVLGPLLFSREFTDATSIGRAVAATALFCAAASAVYVLNDLADREGDRAHPTKRRRPLASGAVSPRTALVVLAALSVPLLLAIPAWPRVGITIWAYIGLFAAYSFGLRSVPFLDLAAIAAGFVLRVRTGAVAIDVHLSLWMASVTFFLALYIAALKRRAEATLPRDASRSVLGVYDHATLDRTALFAGGVTLFAYAAYALVTHPPLVVTVPLVFLGMLRYWRIAHGSTHGEDPARILWSDAWMLWITGSWSVATWLLLWLTP